MTKTDKYIKEFLMKASKDCPVCKNPIGLNFNVCSGSCEKELFKMAWLKYRNKVMNKLMNCNKQPALPQMH